MHGSVRPGIRRVWMWRIVWSMVGVLVAVGAFLQLRGDDEYVVAAAGDIACSTLTTGYNQGRGTSTACRQRHTSELILDADAVLTLGDHQYASGTLTEFNTVYDSTWGRMKKVTYPNPGDHDYANSDGNGDGYFSYFGIEPYYSFDLGSWHLISLNYKLDHSADSVQVRWLKNDLAATTKPCIGAYWGVPMFTSGSKGNAYSYQPFWDALYAAGADVVLSGDTHNYERFAQQTPTGERAEDGLRQFVVGTGGRSLDGFPTVQPNSEIRAKVFGVLKLTLSADSYAWRFETESGGPFTDTGATQCND